MLVRKLNLFPVAVRAHIGNSLHDRKIVPGALRICYFYIKKEGYVGGSAGLCGEPVL